MKTRAWGRASLLGVCVLVTLVRGRGQSSVGALTPTSPGSGNFLPVLPTAEFERQKGCADQVVVRLLSRDRLNDYLLSHSVHLDSSHRITVFLKFKQDMRKILPTLHRFWKFPRWLGGGRYASSFGRAQPGFELHLDIRDPSRTVDFDAPDNSDVDAHEPAGDIESIVLHSMDVMEHRAGVPEKPPCEMLARLIQ